MGCVLTLPATGSESNSGAVITRKSSGDKQHFFSPLVQPRFAVLDPVVTYSLPPRQIANGVVDAFVHTLEQYLTYPVDAKVQDRFAEGLLLTLLEDGRALAEPENYGVRANVMWSATMALNGLIGAGVPQDWATHMLGHELTAMHDLDHAQTLAIVLPALLHEKKAQKRENCCSTLTASGACAKAAKTAVSTVPSPPLAPSLSRWAYRPAWRIISSTAAAFRRCSTSCISTA